MLPDLAIRSAALSVNAPNNAENGKTTLYQLEKLKKETDLKKKIYLQANDLIYVHESAF